jgi:hypothetical protein
VTGRRPYGENEGDVWLMADYFQDRIKADKGPGWRMVVEVLRKEDGTLEEHFYTTEDPELVERADRGHELYVARIASEN